MRDLHLVAGLLLFGLVGCSGEKADDNSHHDWSELRRSGWVEEPVLSGAESTLGAVSPAACENLFRTLDRRVKEDTVVDERGGVVPERHSGTGFRRCQNRAGQVRARRPVPAQKIGLPLVVAKADGDGGRQGTARDPTAALCPRRGGGNGH